MKLWMRRLLWGLMGAGVVALVVWSLLPEPVSVDTAVVVRGPMEVAVEEEGQTRVRDRYVVSAPLGGRLQRIELEAGDAVEAGQVLAWIEPPASSLLDPRARAQAEAQVEAAEAGLAQARTQVERAEAELRYAERELERTRQLAEQDVVMQRELEQAQTTREVQAQQLAGARWAEQVAEHELAMAEAVLAAREAGEPLEVVAPAEGRVLRLHEESERHVGPGEPLVEVGDPDRLEVVADLLSTEAARVEPGLRASIERWGGPGALAGRVRRVEPSAFTEVSALGVEEQRVNVIIDLLELPEEGARLGDRFRVDARIVEWEAADVLTVPTGALFREGGRWAVFRVVEGRAERQWVEIGRQAALEAQVLDGLAEGDRVVVYPGDRIAAGVRVTARGE